MTKTTTIQTVDLWAAIDALDALPETNDTDWYKGLVEAAEAATQAELICRGERHIIGKRFGSMAEAADAIAGWRPARLKPVTGYCNHPFGSRNGYWVVRGDKALSVWKFEKGEASKHAGHCRVRPADGTAYYLDPAIDKEPKMFGCDWEYYVTHGVDNLGKPDQVTTKREKSRRSHSKRYDPSEVEAYIRKGGTVHGLQAKFGMARMTAYRSLKRFQMHG